jgi:putative transposase
MNDRDHALSLGCGKRRRSAAAGAASIACRAQPRMRMDLALLRRIDEPRLGYPFAGSRMLMGLLKAEGHEVGRLHVSTPMKKMAIAALYRVRTRQSARRVTRSTRTCGTWRWRGRTRSGRWI